MRHVTVAAIVPEGSRPYDADVFCHSKARPPIVSTDPTPDTPQRARRLGVVLLPNLFTTGCLACGFFGIIVSHWDCCCGHNGISVNSWGT